MILALTLPLARPGPPLWRRLALRVLDNLVRVQVVPVYRHQVAPRKVWRSELLAAALPRFDATLTNTADLEAPGFSLSSAVASSGRVAGRHSLAPIGHRLSQLCSLFVAAVVEFAQLLLPAPGGAIVQSAPLPAC